MSKQEWGIEGHPQAALLESLSIRVLRHLKISDWREVLASSLQEPIQVQTVVGTVLCVQCPSWGKYPNLKADVTFLARSLGGHVDPCAETEALVLLDGPDDAFRLAMELRELATGIRLHVGMAMGPCDVAQVRCSGRVLNILAGAVVDQAAAECELSPAGTLRMSPSAFESLSHECPGLDACMLLTEYEGDQVAAISVTPPPLRASEQLSSFAGLGLM